MILLYYILYFVGKFDCFFITIDVEREIFTILRQRNSDGNLSWHWKCGREFENSLESRSSEKPSLEFLITNVPAKFSKGAGVCRARWLLSEEPRTAQMQTRGNYWNANSDWVGSHVLRCLMKYWYIFAYQTKKITNVKSTVGIDKRILWIVKIKVLPRCRYYRSMTCTFRDIFIPCGCSVRPQKWVRAKSSNMTLKGDKPWQPRFGPCPIDRQLASSLANQEPTLNLSWIITRKLIHPSWDIFINERRRQDFNRKKSTSQITEWTSTTGIEVHINKLPTCRFMIWSNVIWKN